MTDIVKRAGWLLGIFLVSILASGQEYRSFREERETILRTAEYRIGPFWIFPSIGFRDFGYDSNVYYEREEQTPVSDYTFTIYATARLHYLFHNNILFSLRESPAYVYYFNEKRERGWNNIFAPELRILLLNRFVINGGYLHRKTRYRATSEFNSRVNEYRKAFQGSLFLETPRGTSLGISGVSEEITYDEIEDPSISRSLGRKELEGNLEFYYRVFSDSVFFLKGGYKEYSFIDEASRWRDAYSYQAYSGIQFPLLGRIRGALILGYKKLVPRDANRKGFSGFIGDTSLSMRVSRFTFRFGFNRDFHFSYSSDAVFFIDNEAATGVSFYFTKFLRIDYDFRYGRYNYPEEILVISPGGQPEQIKRSDLYRSHVAGFVIRIIRNTGLGLAINYWARESNINYENRKRFFWGAFVTYEF